MNECRTDYIQGACQWVVRKLSDHFKLNLPLKVLLKSNLTFSGQLSSKPFHINIPKNSFIPRNPSRSIFRSSHSKKFWLLPNWLNPDINQVFHKKQVLQKEKKWNRKFNFGILKLFKSTILTGCCYHKAIWVVEKGKELRAFANFNRSLEHHLDSYRIRWLHPLDDPFSCFADCYFHMATIYGHKAV